MAFPLRDRFLLSILRLVIVCLCVSHSWASEANQVLPTPIADSPETLDLAAPNTAVDECAVLVGSAELTEVAVIDLILARNPSITEIQAAWAAASARFPQARALDDPMVSGAIGPSSIGSPDVDFAYRLEVSQKMPFPGKRNLRGLNALLEASAAEKDVEDMRLQLVERGREAFYEYYLAERSLELNEENLTNLENLKRTAESAYRSGTVTQQDVLLAEVELGRQKEKLLVLQRMHQVAQGRLNTLMHFPPSTRLPSTAKEIALTQPLLSIDELQAQAIASRPDIQALHNRIAADQAMVRLAQKDTKPDFEFFGAYDAFWQAPEDDLRTMVGIRANLPVYREKRRAAITEAHARVAQRHAILTRLLDETKFQIWESYQQVLESQRTIQLYKETIIKAADANVQVALSNYQSGKAPFLTLVDAQRNSIELRQGLFEAQSRYRQRLAVLQRSVGQSPIARNE